MDAPTIAHLLQVNREFYTTVAAPFNQTRYAESPGQQRLLAELTPRLTAPQAHAPTAPPTATTVRVLDVGCGNGRLAWMLDALLDGQAEEHGHPIAYPVAYTGVDAEPQLLELAAQNTRDLAHVRTTFQAADLADPDWSAGLQSGCSTPEGGSDVGNRGNDVAGYDVVVCLATLQHMPGFALRARVVRDLATLLQPTGRLALSAWQFLNSPRLAARQLPWSTVGLDAAQVEPGDALLPWQQTHYAVRYVHQIDPAEMAQLAAEAGLVIETTYFADGREGNLNYYAILHAPGSR